MLKDWLKFCDYKSSLGVDSAAGSTFSAGFSAAGSVAFASVALEPVAFELLVLLVFALGFFLDLGFGR